MSQTVERPSPKTEAKRPTAASRRPANAAPPKPSLLGDIADDLLRDEPSKKPRSQFFLSPFARMRISLVVITLVGLAIVVQLFTLQVQDRYGSRERAAAQRVYESEIPARRGLIRDANGLVLASNTFVYNVYAAPEGLTKLESERIAERLSKIMPNVALEKIKEAVTFSSRKKNWNLVAAAVDLDTADQIRNAQLEGIYLESKPRRTYPNNDFLGQLLGFANNENQGAYGIEGFYNKDLRGTPGKRLAEHDREGNPIVLGQIKLNEAVAGADVTLTIDSGIQFMVERELKKGLEQHKAEKAMAIVADPQTGAILAWASFPNYNPNDFYKTDSALMKDPMVSDVYEPGSTFKILTAAIGIDTGVVKPDSAATLPGCVLEYGRTLCNFDKVGYTNQTVVKTLERSSNVGAMWIAKKYGADKFYEYMRNFGIGAPTGLDLSGEGAGIVRDNKSKDWSPLDFLTNSYGQSIAVTPIQLVQAVGAVANGGKLMKPFVVSKVTRDGKVLNETQPTVVRQVISPESARVTTDMLVNAVKQGETRLADVKGYRVAGKTGTTTLYDSNFTIGSTISYAPADNPRFIVLVRYDKTKDTPWGSNTAAPVVKNIVEQLFVHYGIAPTEK